jgi:hypothetical protein
MTVGGPRDRGNKEYHVSEHLVILMLVPTAKLLNPALCMGPMSVQRFCRFASPVKAKTLLPRINLVRFNSSASDAIAIGFWDRVTMASTTWRCVQGARTVIEARWSESNCDHRSIR